MSIERLYIATLDELVRRELACVCPRSVSHVGYECSFSCAYGSTINMRAMMIGVSWGEGVSTCACVRKAGMKSLECMCRRRQSPTQHNQLKHRLPASQDSLYAGNRHRPLFATRALLYIRIRISHKRQQPIQGNAAPQPQHSDNALPPRTRHARLALACSATVVCRL